MHLFPVKSTGPEMSKSRIAAAVEYQAMWEIARTDLKPRFEGELVLPQKQSSLSDAMLLLQGVTGMQLSS